MTRTYFCLDYEDLAPYRDIPSMKLDFMLRGMVLHKRKMEALGYYPRIYDYDFGDDDDEFYDDYDDWHSPNYFSGRRSMPPKKLPKVYLKRRKSKQRKSKSRVVYVTRENGRQPLNKPNELIDVVPANKWDSAYVSEASTVVPHVHLQSTETTKKAPVGTFAYPTPTTTQWLPYQWLPPTVILPKITSTTTQKTEGKMSSVDMLEIIPIGREFVEIPTTADLPTTTDMLLDTRTTTSHPPDTTFRPSSPAVNLKHNDELRQMNFDFDHSPVETMTPSNKPASTIAVTVTEPITETNNFALHDDGPIEEQTPGLEVSAIIPKTELKIDHEFVTALTTTAAATSTVFEITTITAPISTLRSLSLSGNDFVHSAAEMSTLTEEPASTTLENTTDILTETSTVSLSHVSIEPTDSNDFARITVDHNTVPSESFDEMDATTAHEIIFQPSLQTATDTEYRTDSVTDSTTTEQPQLFAHSDDQHDNINNLNEIETENGENARSDELTVAVYDLSVTETIFDTTSTQDVLSTTQADELDNTRVYESVATTDYDRSVRFEQDHVAFATGNYLHRRIDFQFQF